MVRRGLALPSDFGELSRAAAVPVPMLAKSEVFGTPNFESRFSRQSRPSRLSQASAIAAEVFMNMQVKEQL